MTTELEQEFFKAFGIEPIEYRRNVPCLHFLTDGICNITDERCNPSKCNDYKPDKTHKNWRDFMEVYPEITDRVLLELICIYPYVFSCNPKNIEDFRIEILKRIIAIFNQSLLHKDEQLAIRIRQQIQQLFKEEE